MGHVRHVKDVLAAGDSVEAMVLAVDPVKKRISLSVKQAMGGEVAATPGPTAARVERPRPSAPATRVERPRESAPPARIERPREPAPDAKPAAPTELTPMAIALRKALEKARIREESSQSPG